MSKMSDYLEVELRKHVFRTGSFTKPAALYIGLNTADPTDTGAGAEVAAGGYARVQRDPLDANWSAPDATGGVTANVAVVTFPAATADWGTVTHFSIWDALAAGNLITYGQLTNSRSVPNGAVASFAAGALVITFQ